MNQLLRVEQELEFLRMVLELERELGGEWFVERAAHVEHWSVRMYYPEWKDRFTGGVCVDQSLLGLFYYNSELGANELDEMRENLRKCFQSLKGRYGELLAEDARRMRAMAAAAEEELASLLGS